MPYQKPSVVSTVLPRAQIPSMTIGHLNPTYISRLPRFRLRSSSPSHRLPETGNPHATCSSLPLSIPRHSPACSLQSIPCHSLACSLQETLATLLRAICFCNLTTHTWKPLVSVRIPLTRCVAGKTRHSRKLRNPLLQTASPSLPTRGSIHHALRLATVLSYVTT